MSMLLLAAVATLVSIVVPLIPKTVLIAASSAAGTYLPLKSGKPHRKKSLWIASAGRIHSVP